MKSIAKLMVVAMLLAAALVVAPVAARMYDGTSPDGNAIYNISVGDTIYVGERNLDLTPALLGNTSGWLVHFSSVTDQNVDKQIPISSAGDFELTKSAVGTTTGTYYLFGTTPFAPASAAGTVVVDTPNLDLDVVLNESLIDSVNGKSITRTTPLAFKLTNNLGGFSGITPVTNQAQVKIEVTLPGGGKTTQIGEKEFVKIPVNGSTVYIYNVSLDGYEAGTYTAQAKWYDKEPGASFYGKDFDSNTVTVEVTTKKLAITSDKDSVVRGNSFSVTITGESKKAYNLFVKDVSLDENKYPFILPGQSGVVNNTVYPHRNVTVTTTAGGTRTVQFNTNESTDDRQFTIRVEESGTNNYDEVKVKVEKGAVTITAAGTGTYYIGEEITLEGTCTESDTVYLFLTGPNLDGDGVNPLDLRLKAKDGLNGFIQVEVEADDTWSEKWNTAEIVNGTLDAGGYTIYAVSKPVDKSGLSDAEYDTISIQLRSGFISATSSGAVVAKGDDLKLTGVAQGDPDSVWVWIFGKNKQITDESATVEDDGTFEYELKGSQTKELSPGQYFVVIQHPMMNKRFDIKPGTGTSSGYIIGETGSGFTSVKIDGLQAAAAANALINALDSPNIDDTYVKLTFVVEEPRILIDPIGDVPAGSTFTISGTTNLAVGDTLNVEVTSAAFTPVGKGEESGFASVARTTEVKAGDGANVWSVEIDGSSFKPDQYIVTVECIETDTTATTNFNVVEAVPTTPVVTPTGTVTTTTPPVETTVTPTGTETPGFGALLALAGLGAVAYLVLRRD